MRENEVLTSISSRKSPFNSQFAIRNSQFRKDFGIFFTPDWVVDFMIGLISDDKITQKRLSILEPACGMGQFLQGLKRNKKSLYDRAKKVGVEINRSVYARFPQNEIQMVFADFLLWESAQKFDVIIGNPPYGIPSLSEHYAIKVDDKTKAKYKTLFRTWHGKYNVYGAFIEKSVELLKENGELIFITPASFLFLDEFKKLRAFLAENGDTEIIYMGEEVFEPDASVASVVLKFIKGERYSGNLLLSEYSGGQMILHRKETNWKGDIVTFRTPFSDALKRICGARLGDLFDIRISPRTPEIKKNAHIIRDRKKIDENYLPILNGRNLKVGEIIYEPLTEHWIHKSKVGSLRGYFNKPHIVVGLGFRGERQLAAAFDARAYPWMGDVYHLTPKKEFSRAELELSEEDIARYLNSAMARQYVMDTFREVTYHLSITQLKEIPLPTTFRAS
ncbi:MAG: TaqI-like C-terminal specificity domain-containing protein [Chloroherpetonaceae bacterium]|nr:TaqI-like C-terminal specificity domain-containing protein [Chloroherpetonaceae bacterium]